MRKLKPEVCLNENTKKYYSLICMLLIFPIHSFADVAVGDMIVTLGEDLTEAQKNTLLSEMNAPEDAQIITVSNEEEHQYLGSYISKAIIGIKSNLIFCYYSWRKRLWFIRINEKYKLGNR